MGLIQPQPGNDFVSSVNPDSLTGRGLDVAVARYVFGNEVEERINPKTREKDALYRLAVGDWIPVPFYTASLAVSIQVELKLKDHGWKRRGVGTRPISQRDVLVVLEHRDGRVVEASGAFETALCRAALKALTP